MSQSVGVAGALARARARSLAQQAILGQKIALENSVIS